MEINFENRAGAFVSADLFGTFAALARDEVVEFDALRAHQRHPWHAFLCQCAALALLRAHERAPPTAAEDWRALLLGLTPEWPAGEAWSLVVDDWSTPALLQPPGLEEALRKNGKRTATPDGLDMLLTARNHDLKGARIAAAREDDWLFALVSLQTQEGQMGAGNYGVSRMNGGYGARVGLSLRPARESPGAAFSRDVAQLLARRAEVEKQSEAMGETGLVWLAPWDGATSLSFASLDPYYVEICRRARLTRADGAITAVIGNSKMARIEAKALKGLTGDPWAPTVTGEKSWGVSAQGFGYRQMTDLFDVNKVARPPLAEPVAADGATGVALLASAVARGQGKTEGFHERRIAVPAKAASFMGRGVDRLGHVARERRDAAVEAARILRQALRALVQGGPEQPRGDDDVANSRVAKYERLYDLAVDRAFFDDAFWDHVSSGERIDLGLHAWREKLRDLAHAAFEKGEALAPRTELRRLRALARARAIFHGKMEEWFRAKNQKLEKERSHAG